LPDRLESMQADFEGGQWKELSDKAHNLKGIAANLGLMQLAATAAILDKQSGNGQPTLAGDTLKEIQEMIGSLDSVLRELSE